MGFEYKLIKRGEETFEEIDITISEEAVEDFCEIMGWDEDKFANNTIRYPVIVEEEEEEEPPKKQRRQSKRTGKMKYPEEMTDFIRENMQNMRNPDLCEAINKKFEVNITTVKLAAFMNYNKLKREKKVDNPDDKSEKEEMCGHCKKKIGISWLGGKLLCQRCWDIAKKGKDYVERREKKNRGKQDEEIDDMLG